MSTVSNINATTPTSATSTTSSSSASGQTLTQQDFLKIMVAQFTQQDPLSSGDSSSGGSGTSDYVDQLMSMTNLTTMQTMSSQLATSTGQQALQFAQSLPGSTVDVTGNGGIVTGEVTKARVDQSTNTVYLTVNGTEYASSALISVDAAAAATTPTTSN
jgi:flagellar hook assembly protein FlgD